MIPTSNHNPALWENCSRTLYIFWFLHQTTTAWLSAHSVCSCISFDSYIKPQRTEARHDPGGVVYLLIPTSNHNLLSFHRLSATLYIFWFLHQTTTYMKVICYITCCISFDSYIKPQLKIIIVNLIIVVYLLIPTSNHNLIDACIICNELYIFWFLHQTTTTV